MSAKNFTSKEAEAANIQIVNASTEENENRGLQAVHDLVVAYQANRRSGTANCKTRGEVRGTGKKMYKQKGTGNARHGDKGAPIFVGGGVAHGPKPRDYSKKVTKKTRKLAFQRALGDRINAGAVSSIASFAVADGKTKSFLKEVAAIADQPRVLIVADKFDEQTYQAGRNVQWALLQTATEVNVEQILYYDQIVLVEDAFETLARRSAQS